MCASIASEEEAFEEAFDWFVCTVKGSTEGSAQASEASEAFHATDAFGAACKVRVNCFSPACELQISTL